MRINVYAEELTTETEVVTKTVTDDKFGTRTFYGVRVYLASPDVLHADPADDDRSAITLWVRWTRADGHDFASMSETLAAMHRRLLDVAEQVTQDDGVPPCLHVADAITGICIFCQKINVGGAFR